MINNYDINNDEEVKKLFEDDENTDDKEFGINRIEKNEEESKVMSVDNKEKSEENSVVKDKDDQKDNKCKEEYLADECHDDDSEEDSAISVEGPIRKVVDKIFDKIIKDNDKNPWLFSSYGKIIIYDRKNIKIEQDIKRNLEDKLLDRYPLTKNDKYLTSITSSIMNNLKSRLVTELPNVKMIIDHPVIFENGKLTEEVGYDRDNEIIVLPNAILDLGNDFDYKPTYADMRNAVDYIQDNLFNDFVFLGKSSMANTWAALLHPMIRPFLFEKNKPFYLIQAKYQCSGKTYLTKCITMPHDIDAESKFVALNLSKSELHKTLHSQMLNGDYIMIFDNLDEKEKLESSTFASMLTNRTTNIRELNTSKCTKLMVDNYIVANANGIKISNELKRRCVMIHIDKKLKKHSTYKHPDLMKYLIENRNDILRSLATILIYCYNKNGFVSEDVNELPSFEHYSKIIGNILKVIEVNGFMQDIGEYDREIDIFVRFIEKWYSTHEDKQVRASELTSVWKDVTGKEISDRKLGHILKDRKQRDIDDRFRFTAKRVQNSNSYTLSKID